MARGPTPMSTVGDMPPSNAVRVTGTTLGGPLASRIRESSRRDRQARESASGALAFASALLIQRTPTILCSELYAIPALAGATITVVAIELRHYGAAAAVIAARTCFLIRLLGLRLGLNAPRPPHGLGNDEQTE